jgi:dihydroxyacetone kinase-like predicted kinase
LTRADACDAELITVFTGDGQTPDRVAPLRQAIAQRFPAAYIEVHDGGQPHYRLVIGVE